MGVGHPSSEEGGQGKREGEGGREGIDRASVCVCVSCLSIRMCSQRGATRRRRRRTLLRYTRFPRIVTLTNLVIRKPIHYVNHHTRVVAYIFQTHSPDRPLIRLRVGIRKPSPRRAAAVDTEVGRRGERVALGQRQSGRPNVEGVMGAHPAADDMVGVLVSAGPWVPHIVGVNAALVRPNAC